MIKNVKKLGSYYFPMLLILILVLCSALTGCKKFTMPTGFTEEFGKEKPNAFTGMEKISSDMDVLTAWNILVNNYNYVPYVAQRQLSNVIVKDMGKQMVTVTKIKDYDNVWDKTKIYNEDATVAVEDNLGFMGYTDSIEQVYFTKEKSNENYKIRYANSKKVEYKDGLIALKKGSQLSQGNTINSTDEYVKAKKQNLFDVTHLIVNSETINMAESSLKQGEEGFLDMHLVFEPNLSTVNYKKLIAQKAGAKPDAVTFSKMELDIKIWEKFGCIRSIKNTENYKLEIKISMFGSTQDIALTGNCYFSYDFTELPLEKFAF